MSNLQKAYALDIRIRLADEKDPPQGVAVNAEEYRKDGIVYEKDGVRVTAFEVDHGELIKPAYGYRVDYKGHWVVISGDTRFNKNVIKYSTGADVLIHEVAAAKPEISSIPAMKPILAHHTSPRECGIVFNLAKPKLAVYSHISRLSTAEIPEASLEEIVTETRQTYSGALEVGEDLMSFEIDEGVTVHRHAR